MKKILIEFHIVKRNSVFYHTAMASYKINICFTDLGQMQRSTQAVAGRKSGGGALLLPVSSAKSVSLRRIYA